MIKHVIFFVLVFVLIGVSFVYAAPVGNIAKPAMLKSAVISKDAEKPNMGVIVEGEFDFVSNMKLKDSDSKDKYRFLGSKLDLVLMDKVIVYGLLGGAYYETKFNDEGSEVKIETKNDLAWGIGATAILYETKIEQFGSPTLRFGVDGRYRSTELDVDKIIIDGTEYKIPSGSVTAVSIEYKDWQIAGEVSSQWGRFIPYVGVKYSDMDAKASMTVSGTTYTDDNFKLKHNVGVFVGADLLALDSMSLNVEGRFINEEALTLGCAVRF